MNQQCLYGSSVLPGSLWIGERLYSLGDIVRRSFVESGFSAEEWNSLESLDREFRLVRTIYGIRKESAIPSSCGFHFGEAK